MNPCSIDYTAAIRAVACEESCENVCGESGQVARSHLFEQYGHTRMDSALKRHGYLRVFGGWRR